MRAIKKKTGGKAEFFGIGGDTMEKEGMSSLFDISELAIMGLCEVIPSIPRVLKRIGQTVDDIVRLRPDVVISIDSWSFGSRVQKKLRALKTGIPQIHYVAPQVWAWKRNAPVPCTNTLIIFLPCFLRNRNISRLTGCRPLLSAIRLSRVRWFTAIGKFSVANTVLTPHKKIICLLPGSRHNEVSRLLPIFLEAAQMLKQQHPELFLSFRRLKRWRHGLKTCLRIIRCRCWWWKAKKIATTQ